MNKPTPLDHAIDLSKITRELKDAASEELRVLRAVAAAVNKSCRTFETWCEGVDVARDAYKEWLAKQEGGR